MDDREKFEKYADKVNAMLRSEDFYAAFRRRLRASRPEFKLNRKDRKKHFELDWIEMIESCIVNLDNIVRNPRKFIVVEEDIVDISLARAISTESIKHLAQHTNMIAAVDKEGNVTPNKILNTTKEESFEVYENRFIYTLLKNLSNFVTRRLDAIKMSYVNDHILELTAKGNFFMGKTRVFCNFEIVGSLPTDPEQEAEQSRDVEILQRVTKLQRVISDFLSSPFAKQMINSAPVRPPITRTNVILKNPDFKKALVLWQFIESYTKMGFQVENDIKKMPVDEKVDTLVSDMMCLSNMIMEGLIHGEAQDMAFFDEANMTEEEQKEKEEVEKADKKEEEQAAEEEQPKETGHCGDPQHVPANGRQGHQGGASPHQFGDRPRVACRARGFGAAQDGDGGDTGAAGGAGRGEIAQTARKGKGDGGARTCAQRKARREAAQGGRASTREGGTAPERDRGEVGKHAGGAARRAI